MEFQENKYQNTPKKENPAFNPYLIVRRVILPFWPIYVIGVLAAFFGARIYISSQLPIFQCESKVLLKLNNDVDKSLLKELSTEGNGINVNNEIELLKSEKTTESVIKNLNAFYQVIEKGDVTTVYHNYNSIINLTPIDYDSIKSVSMLRVTFNVDKLNFGIGGRWYNYRDSLINISGCLYKINIKPETIKNINLNNEYYLNIQTVNQSASSFSRGLTVTPDVDNESLISLSVNTPNFFNGNLLLNEVMRIYLEESVIEKRRSSLNSLKFIQDRIDLINNELDSIERQIELLKVARKITNISTEASIYLNKINESDKRLATLDLKESIILEIEKNIKSANNEGLELTIPSTTTIGEPQLTAFLQKLYDLEVQKKSRLKFAGATDESYINLTEQIKKLKANIDEHIQTIKSNNQLERQMLVSQKQENNFLLEQVPNKERSLLDITRQQNIKNGLYTFLLEKREEAAISYSATTIGSKVLEQARNKGQIYPKPNLTYIMWITGGYFIPLLFIFWKVQLSPRIKSKDELEYLTDLDIIGEIPFDEKKRKLVTSLKDRGISSETFRSLRTKLSNRSTNGSQLHSRSFIISSSLPGEGKTFISSNLAISFALTGKKVVIVGADMRKPTIHRYFNVRSKNGLSSYLSGISELDEVIFDTDFDGLSIIPAGIIPPNPAEMFESNRFGELMDSLKSTFDIIVFDTPPLGLVSDFEVLSQHFDTVIFVVRQNVSFKDSITEVINKFHNNHQDKNINIVYNGIKGIGIGVYKYYGYGNYYGYGTYYGGYYGSSNGIRKTGYGYYLNKIFKRFK